MKTWIKQAVLLVSALCLLGCGPKKVELTNSDRRDAKLALEQLEPGCKAISYQQAHPNEQSSHSDPTGNGVGAIIKIADQTREKYKGTPIDPQVSPLCLALTKYWELPDGKGDKAKAAAAEVEQAKAALQAVAEGK